MSDKRGYKVATTKFCVNYLFTAYVLHNPNKGVFFMSKIIRVEKQDVKLGAETIVHCIVFLWKTQ